jgi:hypothetical protein
LEILNKIYFILKVCINIIEQWLLVD